MGEPDSRDTEAGVGNLKEENRLLYGSKLLLTPNDWVIICYIAACRFIQKYGVPNPGAHSPESDLVIKLKGVIGEYAAYLIAGLKIDLRLLRNDNWIDSIKNGKSYQIKFTPYATGKYAFDRKTPEFNEDELAADFYLLFCQGTTDDEISAVGFTTREIAKNSHVYDSLGKDPTEKRHQLKQHVFADISEMPGLVKQGLQREPRSAVTHKPNYMSIFRRYFNPIRPTWIPNIAIENGTTPSEVQLRTLV